MGFYCNFESFLERMRQDIILSHKEEEPTLLLHQ